MQYIDFKAQKFLINVSDTDLYIKQSIKTRGNVSVSQPEIEMARAAGAWLLDKLTELSFREPMLQSGSNEQIRLY